MNLTTLLDLAGALLLIAALALALATISLPLALAAAGAGLLGLSWLIDANLLKTRRRGKR